MWRCSNEPSKIRKIPNRSGTTKVILDLYCMKQVNFYWNFLIEIAQKGLIVKRIFEAVLRFVYIFYFCLKRSFFLFLGKDYFPTSFPEYLLKDERLPKK